MSMLQNAMDEKIRQSRSAGTALDNYLLPLRVAQQGLGISALVLCSSALDRTLITKAGTADEILMMAAIAMSLLVLPLQAFNNRRCTSSPLTPIVDGTVALLLVAAWVLAAAYQGKNLGSCVGPAFSGVYDNLRACRKMQSAVIIAAIDSLSFGITAAITLVRYKRV